MNFKKGFTLAEVLITLVVIGVVAVVTMPALINKIQEQQFDKARQKALLTIGEAGKIMAVQGRINDAIDTEDFVKNYLSKYLKIAKYCGTSAQDIQNCGFASQINKMDNSGTIAVPRTIGILNNGAFTNATQTRARTSYAIVMANGYSANVYYNPNCRTLSQTEPDNPSIDSVCMNVIYDMNGIRKPNEVGKDIGWVSVIGNNESAVAVAPAFGYATNRPWKIAVQMCSDNGQTLPNWYELESMAFNWYITNMTGYNYWSSNLNSSSTQAWRVGPNSGDRGLADIGSWVDFRCVKR